MHAIDGLPPPQDAPASLDEQPSASLQQAMAHAERLLQGHPELAAEQASEILRAVGEYPPARLLLGLARLAGGDTAGALETLGNLVGTQPVWARARLEYGLALGQAGQGDAAVAELQEALRLKPDLAAAWLALGDHHSAQGNEVEASRAYANHLRYCSRDPALLAAGAALVENRLDQAEAGLRAHLKALPNDVAALRMLAEVAARLGRHEDAEQLLARCLQLAPEFHAARQNYALMLYRTNQPERALEEIEVLLRQDSRNPGHRNLKAVLLCRIGDYAPALELYSGILGEYPHQAKIWVSYGHALKTAGRQDEAIAAYRRSIALEPSFGEAWWSLANLKTLRFDDGDIAAMRAQLARSDIDDEQRLHFDFALGKALEDAGDHAASFAHYRDGNALRRQRVPYRAADNHARVQHAMHTFDADFFAARRGYGSPVADPIFIVGLPRAGSTLVEQILSSHSQVEGTMELPEIITMARQLNGRSDRALDARYHLALAGLDAEQCRALGDRYLQRTRIHRKSAAPSFIDKMPNNFSHLPLIHLALPNARIVDVRRHPLSCCFSGFKQHFARGQNFSYDLEDIGRYYRDYVELMAHFDQVLPGRVHRVIYETLVDDTEVEVRRLLAHCGLPFEDACLRFFENDRPVRTASSEQVRQPINRRGLEQWKHFETWLDPLKQILGPVLDSYPAVPNIVAGSRDC